LQLPSKVWVSMGTKGNMGKQNAEELFFQISLDYIIKSFDQKGSLNVLFAYL